MKRGLLIAIVMLGLSSLNALAEAPNTLSVDVFQDGTSFFASNVFSESPRFLCPPGAVIVLSR